MNKKILSLMVIGSCSVLNPVFAEDEIPVVPMSVMDNDNEKSQTQTSTINNNANIVVKEGVNYLIPIAISHPNRIVTPFQQPEVVSTSLTGMKADGSCGEICVKDNVVYIATDKETPVTAYITEKGSQKLAISLTMVPKKIPPREVSLQLSESQTAIIPLGNKKAEAFEQSQPYVQSLTEIMRKLALNDIPDGYTSHKISKTMPNLPICTSEYRDVNFVCRQIFQGHNFNVYVGVAKNIKNHAVEIKESMCGGWDVAAVASFPRYVLQPNEKTEIYVIKKVTRSEPIKNYRPSLVD